MVGEYSLALVGDAIFFLLLFLILCCAEPCSLGQAVHRIPKHLHQIWLQGPDDKFERYRPWQQSWLNNHPHWQYTLWSDKEITALIGAHYSWFLPYYMEYPHWIQRVDVAKYFILHHLGGVYVDMDMRSIRPLDNLVDTDTTSFFASANSTGIGGESVVGAVNNCVIGSTPGHQVWNHMFPALMKNHKQKWYQGHDHYIHASTGILRFTTAVTDGQTKGDDRTIQILPTNFFSPASWVEANDWIQTLQREYPDSYAVHGYSGTWVSKTGVVWSNLTRVAYRLLQEHHVALLVTVLVVFLLVFIAFFVHRLARATP